MEGWQFGQVWQISKVHVLTQAVLNPSSPPIRLLNF